MGMFDSGGSGRVSGPKELVQRRVKSFPTEPPVDPVRQARVRSILAPFHSNRQTPAAQVRTTTQEIPSWTDFTSIVHNLHRLTNPVHPPPLRTRSTTSPRKSFAPIIRARCEGLSDASNDLRRVLIRKKAFSHEVMT